MNQREIIDLCGQLGVAAGVLLFLMMTVLYRPLKVLEAWRGFYSEETRRFRVLCIIASIVGIPAILFFWLWLR